MTLTFNNVFILNSAFFFLISWFFMHLFIKSNLFFKIIVFLMSFSVFITLETLNSLEMTLVSIAGAIIGFFGGFSKTISGIADLFYEAYDILRNTLLWIINVIKAILRGLSAIFGFILKIFRFFKKTSSHEGFKHSKPHKKQKPGQHSSGHQKNTQSEQQKRREQAREDFKRSREEAERQAQEAKQSHHDNRSLEAIIGVQKGYTKTELKTAYKKTCSQYHPDKHEQMSDEFRAEATEEFKRVQKAYTMLLARL